MNHDQAAADLRALRRLSVNSGWAYVEAVDAVAAHLEDALAENARLWRQVVAWDAWATRRAA